MSYLNNFYSSVISKKILLTNVWEVKKFPSICIWNRVLWKILFGILSWFISSIEMTSFGINLLYFVNGMNWMEAHNEWMVWSYNFKLSVQE